MKQCLFSIIICAVLSMFLSGCCGLNQNNKTMKFVEGFHEGSVLKDDIFFINNLTNSWCDAVMFDGFVWESSPYESLLTLEKICSSKYPEVKFCIEDGFQGFKWHSPPKSIEKSVSLQDLLWRLTHSCNLDVFLVDKVVFIGYYRTKLFLPYTIFLDVVDANNKIIEDAEFGADTTFPVYSKYIQDGLYAVIIHVPYKFLGYNNIEISLSDEIFKSINLYVKRKNVSTKTKIKIEMLGGPNHINFNKVILK